MSKQQKVFDAVPTITEQDAKDLCLIYGIDAFMIRNISSLPSYEDIIYHIDIHPKYRHQCPSCVLKASIVFSTDTVDMQCAMS